MSNRFKFAVNTNSLPKGQPFEQTVRLAAAVKADGIEWGLSSLETAAADAREMAKITRDHGLEVAAFINAGHLTKTDQIRRWSEAVAGAGGKTLRVAPLWAAWNYDESIHQRDAFPTLFGRVREGLEKLVPLGKEFQIRYVLEMHPGNVLPSAELARKLMDGLDPRCAGAIYDPANGIVEGHLRPRTAVELLGPYLAYVHVKNIRWEKLPDDLDDGGCKRAKWEIKTCRLDEGILDWVEVFFALNVGNFSGWLALEEFFRPDPAVELARGMAFLRQAAEAAAKKPCEPFTTFNA